MLLLLGLVTGCGKKSVEITPDLASSDEALYKLGEQEIKKDTEKALLYLRQVIDSFPKSFYAQRAKLLIADAYFRKGDESNMILAAAEYREFIRSYPYSPSAAYSQYQIAMTFYKKMLKPGRDPSKTIQALAEFKKVITDYPASDQAKDAQEKIKECEERLASHSAEIAIGYYKRRGYLAAISRLTEIMTTYPELHRARQRLFLSRRLPFHDPAIRPGRSRSSPRSSRTIRSRSWPRRRRSGCRRSRSSKPPAARRPKVKKS